MGLAARDVSRVLLSGHTAPVKVVAFSPDGKGVATGPRDGTARLWTLGHLRSTERAVGPHDGEVNSVAYAPDGQTLATGCADGVVRLWDVTGITPKPRAEARGHAGGVRVVLITPDGKTLVSVGDDQRVLAWDALTGAPAREGQLPAPPGRSR